MMKHHVDTTKPTEVTHLSLCTGYGGIDLGLARVVSNLRTIAYCEREAAAVELLLSRMEGGQLDAAPIWTDLRTFPWEAFSDRVWILSSGYPCQPFSSAGKRIGTNDERHLWPAIADGIRILRPRICFFENVEGHVTLGLSTVISDLEELGYKVSWGIFSAAEVGAPHQRKRVFVLAYRCGEGLEGDIAGLLVPRGRQKPSRPTASRSRSGGERGMADSNGTGSGEDWKSSEPRATGLEQSPCTQGRSDEGEAREKQVWPSRPGELADATSGRCDGQHSRSDSDVGQWTAAQDIRPKATNSSGCGTTQIWPSRPGEPQYWWEPPRVVADSESERANRGQQLCREECGQERELSRESHESGEIVADSRRDQCERRSPVGEVPSGNDGEAGACEASGEGGENEAGERTLTESGGIGAEPAVGDSEMLHGSGQTGGQRKTQARRTSAAWHDGQTQSKVGGGIDGAADWVDYVELCVSCDNRTDELRMLGNGVLPATAAKSFVTLMEELNNHHEQRENSKNV